MRAFVFTDAALASEAGRFVWLALDVENVKNAAARKTYPAVALPTYLLLDPVDGSVARRWVGGMTVAQLQAFLHTGEAAVAARRAGASDLLALADRAYAAGDYAAAAVAFDSVFAHPEVLSDFGDYARAAEAALFSYSMTDRNDAGLAIAGRAMAHLGRSTTGASAAAQGLGFALALPDTVADRAGRIAMFETTTRAFLVDSTIALSGDDRSGMLGVLLEARQDAKDEEGAKAAAAAWASHLEAAAKEAATPDGSAVYDSHRLSAYLEMGTPEKAVAMLEASEKALPGDYNPPFRLAVALNALKRWDEAIAATGRALALAYGPRKIRIYMTRADAQAGRGDVAAARATLEETLAYARSLPEGQVSAATFASLERKRDGLVTSGK